MRKIFAVLLCLSLVCLPVEARQEQKYVVLTFDDGPSGSYTRRLLKGLRQRSVQATFLLCGYRMMQFPDITQQIFEEGHEIGCHGYSHDDMSAMSRRQISREIQRFQDLLPEGCRVTFLRPPGGNSSQAVCQVAEARSLSILTWSVDPRDWATQDTWAVERSVLNQVRDGDVILLHDMSDSSVQAALDIVDSLRQRGFQFVTASELARLRGDFPKPGKLYHSFPPAQNP